MDTVTLTAAALIAAVAGIVRGITGFGGAMVAAPLLALLLGPNVAVPVVRLLESIVAAIGILLVYALPARQARVPEYVDAFPKRDYCRMQTLTGR